MRRNDREIWGRVGIQRTLGVAKALRLGLTDGDHPYTVPLHYGYVYAGDVLRLCMHNTEEGKKLTFTMSNPHAFVELDCEAETTGEGDIAYAYDANYASLMTRGETTMIEGPEEEIGGLKFLMRTQTGRDFEITAQQTAGATVLRSDAESHSIKERKKK